MKKIIVVLIFLQVIIDIMFIINIYAQSKLDRSFIETNSIVAEWINAATVDISGK